MHKTSVVIALVGAMLLPGGVMAQDAKAVVERAIQATGSAGLTSITYSGLAANTNFGQSRTIYVQGEDAFRRPKVYSAEWASVSRLERDGISKRTLREGDRVRIWASPNRDPNDNRVRLKRIERRADRWSWGSRGETR